MCPFTYVSLPSPCFVLGAVGFSFPLQRAMCWARGLQASGEGAEQKAGILGRGCARSAAAGDKPSAPVGLQLSSWRCAVGTPADPRVRRDGPQPRPSSVPADRAQVHPGVGICGARRWPWARDPSWSQPDEGRFLRTAGCIQLFRGGTIQASAGIGRPLEGLPRSLDQEVVTTVTAIALTPRRLVPPHG